MKLGSSSPPILFFCFNVVLAILGLLPLCMNFSMSLLISKKMDFGGDYIESISKVGKN